MSTTPETPHVTHLIDAYLAGGLEEADRQAVDAHVAICTACAAALDAARTTDRELSDLFAAARPNSGFEDRLVSQLRPVMQRPARRWNRQSRHPLVRRIAVGVAATIILGGVGFGMQVGLHAMQLAKEERVSSARNARLDRLDVRLQDGSRVTDSYGVDRAFGTVDDISYDEKTGKDGKPAADSKDKAVRGPAIRRTSEVDDKKSGARGVVTNQLSTNELKLRKGIDIAGGTTLSYQSGIVNAPQSGGTASSTASGVEVPNFTNAPDFDQAQQQQAHAHYWAEMPKPAQIAQSGSGAGLSRTSGAVQINGENSFDGGGFGGGRGQAVGGIGGGGGGSGGGFGNAPSAIVSNGTITLSTAQGITQTEGTVANLTAGVSRDGQAAPGPAPKSSPTAGIVYTDGIVPGGVADSKSVRGLADSHNYYGWQALPNGQAVSGKLAASHGGAAGGDNWNYTGATPAAPTAGPVASSSPRVADPAAPAGAPAKPSATPAAPATPPADLGIVANAGSAVKGAKDAKAGERSESLLDAPKVQLGSTFRPGEVFKERSDIEAAKNLGSMRSTSGADDALAFKKRAEAGQEIAAGEPAPAVAANGRGDSSGPEGDTRAGRLVDRAGKPADQNGSTGVVPPEATPTTPATPAIATPDSAPQPAATVPPPATPQPQSPPQAPPENAKPDDPGPKVKPAHVEAPERRPNEPVKRMVIRNGTLQFEVDSFDSALLQMNKIVAEEGGYLSGTSSDKLPNGKVRGVVTLRCPPDRLDTLVLKLRGMGDLKSQRIAAEDVTKHFTDLDSQYRAAKAMEKRLLAIIEAGGLVKDLLEAEKQLGVWREKIEVLEGEMRYIQDQVAWSTLTVELMERDVRTPTAASEQETVNTSIETEDVEKSRADVLKAIDGVKGRVIDSDLKKFEGGQLSATIVADVAPDSAGTVIDRLRQLGKLARLDISRKTTTQGGTGPIIPGLKVERKETRLQIAIYNLANISPRQSTTLNLAAPDVEASYKAIIEQVKSAGGRIVSSQLNRPKADQTVGTVVFESPTEKAEVLLGAVRANVEVMRMEVTQNADTQNTTEAKRGFSVQIYSLAHVPARETTTLQLAAPNVSQSFNKVLEAAKTGGGRIVTSQLNEQDPNNITGNLEFEVLREKWQPVADALQQAGIVVTRNVARSPDTESTVDSKIRLSVTLIDDIRLAPRETVSARVATATVADTFATLVSAAKEAGARVVGSNLNLNDRANPSGTLNFAIPRDNAAKFENALKAAGLMVSRTVNRQADGPMNVDSKVGFDVAVFDELQLAPRETVTAVVATRQVPDTFNTLANAAREAGARVVGSSIDLSRVRPTGDLSFSVPKENAQKFEDAMKAAGLVINRTVTRQQDGPMVADGRTGFAIAVRDERTMQPRETHTLSVMTKSVNDRYRDLLETLRNLDADVLQSVMRQQGNDQRIGELTFVIKREDRDRLERVLSTSADVFGHTVERSPDTQNTVDHRLLYQVKLLDADQQKPRQTYDITAEVTDLEKAANEVDVIAASVGGRSGASKRFNEKGRGDVVDVTIDVPSSKAGEVLNNLRSLGKVVITNQTRDDSVPEGSLSRARLQIQFTLPTAVGAERGMGESLRLGLNSGLNLVSAAAGYLVTGLIGLVVVLVFLVILWGIFRVARWMRRDRPQDQTPPSDGGTGTPATPAPATA